MLLNRKQLRKLLYEIVLLERLSKQSLIGKIRYLSAYNNYLDKLNPKYYDTLDRLISEYDSSGATSVSHGVIIFMLTMHQKYASTNVLPAEFKDYSQLNLDQIKKAIEGIGAQYTDSALYGELVELDKKQSDQKLEDDSKEEPDDTGAASKKVNREVRPGLYLLNIIDGWQIHKPTTVAGSRAFGVESWCTVYSDAFSTYKNSGITLYYLCKDGKDYDERGYGFDYRQNPYDYVCIGFEEDTIAIPSGDYQTSVWGNQTGVTYDNIKRVMGASSDKILRFISDHFGKEYSASGEANPQEYLKRKLAAAAATIPRALKVIARSKGPDDTFKLILECLSHPKLNEATMQYIFKKFYLKIDSKMQKTEAFASDVYKQKMLVGFLNVHALIPDSIKNELALQILDNFNSLCRYLGDYASRSIENAGLWTQELSQEVYEKFFELLSIETIQTFDSPGGDYNREIDGKLFDIFIKNTLGGPHGVDGGQRSAVKLLEEYYDLGIFDEVVNIFINNSNMSYGGRTGNHVPTYDTRFGKFTQIINAMMLSPHTSNGFKQDIISRKITYAFEAPDAELEYSGEPYKKTKIGYEGDEFKSKEMIALSKKAERLHTILDRGGVQGNFASRQIISDALNGKTGEPIKKRLLELFREYLSTHNKIISLAEDLSVPVQIESDIYGPVASIVSFLPADEMGRTIENFKGITRNSNDYYFVHKLIDSNNKNSSTLQHKVEIFDYVQNLLNKYSAQGSSDNNDRNLKNRLSRLVYGGYDGGVKNNNAALCYQLFKEKPGIFFTCMAYHFNNSDPYDAGHFAAEWHKIFTKLVLDGDITHDQAMKDIDEINAVFYERMKDSYPSEYRLAELKRGILNKLRIPNPADPEQ